MAFQFLDAVDFRLTEEDLFTRRVMRAARVLVVEDNEAFSRFISAILQQEPTLELVGAVSDGLTAVHSAEDLQPDLILLDIGLPKQNGIEAAKQIRQRAPQAKIIFVSQESSPTIIWRALDLGARGYVLKSDVATELLAAMSSALKETSYVSAGCREALAGAVLRDHIGEMQLQSADLQDHIHVRVD
jgi:DNA-binding NarL/FixJ family response regulator